jgi:hypothetical protein
MMTIVRFDILTRHEHYAQFPGSSLVSDAMSRARGHASAGEEVGVVGSD